jgi:hypothetical protein
VSSSEVLVGKGFEVIGGQEDRIAYEVVVKEVIEAREVLVPGSEGSGGRKGGVGSGKGDVVESCKPEEEFWGERAFKVKMLFAFRKSLEKWVEGCLAHIGD